MGNQYSHLPKRKNPDEVTHPYPGTTVCSYFSDGDFIWILTLGKVRILIAHSGYWASLVVRSASACAKVSEAAVKADYDAYRTAHAPSKPFPMDVFETSKDMCAKYGLNLYVGQLKASLLKV